MRGRLRTLFSPSDGTDPVVERIAERGRELEERSAQLRSAVAELEHREEQIRELSLRVEQILRDGAAELDLRQAELAARSAELGRRETAAAEAEAKVEERRRALGAVELREAAVERREEAARVRELELESRAEELAELAQRLDELGRAIEDSGTRPARDDEHVGLLSGERYRLVVRPGRAPQPGEIVELEDGLHVCVRITASPFPRDDRGCAVLEPLSATDG